MKKTKRYLTVITVLTLSFTTLKCSAQYTKLFDFNGINGNGDGPEGSLYYDGTFLYGMTVIGGKDIAGNMFKIKPDGTRFDTLLSFNCTNGSYPTGGLISDGTYLYGMTNGGCDINDLPSLGYVFKIKPDGTGFDTLLHFINNTNQGGVGSLLYDGIYLYGMTQGNLFKIKPHGTGDTVLYKVGNPGGSLISDGTFLYGMTSSNIFKIKPDGTECDTLLKFNGNNESPPFGSLTSDGTYLYGMTYGSRSGNYGTIFKIKTDGTGDTVLLNFNVTNGAHPFSSLIYDGTYLYGMTDSGGTNNLGVLFKIKTDGTEYSKLLDFDSINGSNPSSPLISDGTYLYGMTTRGGAYNGGTVFKYQYCYSNCTPVTGITEYNLPTINIYPNPTSGVINLNMGQLENAQVNVYNVLGESIYQHTITSSIFQIDLSAQPNGIYLIKIVTQQGVVSKSLVISR